VQWVNASAIHHLDNSSARTHLAHNDRCHARSQALYRMSLHIKSEMVAMIYSKSLRVTGGVRSGMGVGAIVNLQSNDASKLWGTPMYIHMVWNGPFQVFGHFRVC
jgi:hypothetical protein